MSQQAKQMSRKERRVAKLANEVKAVEAKLANQKTSQKAKTKKAKAKVQKDAMLSGKLPPKLLPYLKTLTAPSVKNMSRVPDSFNYPTALVHSRHVVEVEANQFDDVNANKFAYFVSPTLMGAPFLLLYNPVYELKPGPTNLQYGDYEFAQGAHVAYLDPEIQWSPGTAFNPQVVPPAPKVVEKIPKHQKSARKSQAAPEVTPAPVPQSTTAWKYLADPNSEIIGGTQAEGYADGLAETVRPVGMSVWFQCTLPEINNGGDVSACLLPPGVIDGNIAPLNWNDEPDEVDAVFTGQGSLCEWDNLATFPGAYTGKIKDGSYSYWVPSRVEDLNMQSISSNISADFPCIAVAGRWANTGAPGGIVGKLIIETVWEYTTNSQVPELSKGPCVPNALEQIKCVLYDQPTSMPNDSHRAWWQKLIAAALSGGAAFFAGGPPAALAAAGATLAAM